MSETFLQRVVRRFEWPMALLALLVVPVLVMEDRATTLEMRQGAILINWVIWMVFVVEFGIRWAADRTLAFPRKAWFDLLLIVLTPPFGVPEAMQSIRSLRLLRLLRLVHAFGVAAMGFRLAQRHFGKKKFHYVLLVGFATVVGGAVAVFALEAGENANIRHFGDALWWAVTTVTTVGYGDITPVTPEGRVVAVLLMLTGIGVIGVFTATAASHLFEEQRTESPEMLEILARLTALERKVDQLIEVRRETPRASHSKSSED
jgi:voltage-gated potassium channel